MRGSLEHLLLKKIYVNSLEGISSSLSVLTRQLGLSNEVIEPRLLSLLEKGSLEKDDSGCFKLSKLGRKQLTVVLTGGTFDLLHTGHIFTFQQSKLLGDLLVVVIATDKTVEKSKNHTPTNSQTERAQVVKHIREVDAVIVGDENDFINTVDLIKPDLIALGYDQKHDEKKLYSKLSSRGHEHVKIIRLKKHIPGKSTSRIVQDIINHNYRE
ncbi:MAG: FAD synthase [Candidatus Heimdallarchaeota archaeon]|nr:FAD synthase [Candidatus Heimdallarchaeota archaeon]MCK4954182.1 FAD synthase [Candidatus Heimdallarchaeota archaeon]